MAERRLSSRQASRRARYSMRESALGGAISYLGCVTCWAGLDWTRPWDFRNLKRDLMELTFRLIDLAV